MIYSCDFSLTFLAPSIDGHRARPHHKGVVKEVDLTAHRREQNNRMVHSPIPPHLDIISVRLHGRFYSESKQREITAS